MATASPGTATSASQDRIQPWNQDPRYWQYKGQPILLVGGSVEDNLFQIPDLEQHLDDMREVGANYIRNTMSDRDEGDVRAYKRLASGLFDLALWNDEYWDRFESLLRWTAERDIIVQLEVWDRFDHSRDCWETDPYRPSNNVNYTGEETGLAEDYPRHPGGHHHPFFHCVPGMPAHETRFDAIRPYQEAYVDKLLSHSLPYGNVLYCMNNETSDSPVWGQYWIEFIRRRAEAAGVTVYCTDMFDDWWKAENNATLRTVMDDPATYSFVDISQVNSRNFGQVHWDRLQWLIGQARRHLRPVNTTKVYGSGYKAFGTGGPEDGVERLIRNLLGGCAGSRFHRPDSGNGLNHYARGAIRALRLLEQHVKLWDVEPHMELLSDRGDNEAYVAADPGSSYVVYFTYGGKATLDLSACDGPTQLRWFSVAEGAQVRDPVEISPGVVELETLASGGWLASITRQ